MTEKILLSEKTIDIRWTDMDSHRHVNNGNYFHYMTELRHDLLLKPFLPNRAANFFLVNIGCTFKRALAYPDQVLIKQYLTGIGKSSFSLLFEFYDVENNLTSVGDATLVSVDAHTNKVIPIPESIQAILPFIEQKPARHTVMLAADRRVLTKKTIPLRWTDMDAFNHLSNAMYFDFFGEARLATLPTKVVKELPFYFFLVNTRCDFLKPIHYPANITLEVGIVEFKRSSFSMFGQFGVEGSEEIYANGLATIVCVDKKTLKPVAVPEQLVNALSLILGDV